jgi:polyphosphate:AMP phosphotransferase
MWRFWSRLPAAGILAIFDRSWYGRVLTERVEETTSRREWNEAYDDIQQFERQLADDGAVIVKFWLHISKKEQKQRFKQLEENSATAWKVGKQEWKNHRKYDEWVEAVEEVLERTSTAQAPWTVVESTQGRYARVKVFETVLEAVEHELDRRASAEAVELKPMPVPADSPTRTQTILDRVDLSLSLERGQYEEEIARLQERLFHIEHELYIARVPAVVVYEGWDAGGKGGNIRRLTRGLDPRGYEVVPVGPPTTEEKSHHYLWRFWRDVPKAGHITIFDRSWYGRLLVERVEGFCREDEWKRAFREINEFERQLAEYGTVMVKFWLQIDREEQLRRFKAREQSPDKQWKITDDDWRNREKWKQYKTAVVDMLRRTSTTYAPWTILEANCKLHARIKALRTAVDALESALRRA